MKGILLRWGLNQDSEYRELWITKSESINDFKNNFVATECSTAHKHSFLTFSMSTTEILAVSTLSHNSITVPT